MREREKEKKERESSMFFRKNEDESSYNSILYMLLYAVSYNKLLASLPVEE